MRLLPIASKCKRTLKSKFPFLVKFKRLFVFYLRTITGKQQKSLNERVQITISCRDCDYIPKVSNAGDIVTQNGERVQIMHNGVGVLAGSYHGAWMSEIISALRGHHEPQEEKVFHEVINYIKPDFVMVELGCFWAYYSLWFKKVFPNSRVICIEPIEKNLEIGKRNFEINDWTAEFFLGYIGMPNDETEIFESWDGSLLPREKIILDNFAEIQGIDHISILHADIQGAELCMLKGAEKLLRESKIEFMFISTHDDKHDPCLRKIQSFGYKIIAEHKIEESFSADGLIVAKSPNSLGPRRIDVSKRV